MLRSRNRLRRFNRRHNPQPPVWQRPLFTDTSPVWREPLFRNPDEDSGACAACGLTSCACGCEGDPLRCVCQNSQAPASNRHFRRRNPAWQPASRRYFRNPQPPVWQQPLWSADSPVWRGPLYRNPEELELDEEVIMPASRRHFRRYNPAVGASLQPQAPVWKGPLWSNDSPVWRGPLFRNPDEDGDDDLAPAPFTSASRRYFRRRNPQSPVWQTPLYNDNSAVWRGPLFRNPDEETCEICNLRKNPYRQYN